MATPSEQVAKARTLWAQRIERDEASIRLEFYSGGRGYIVALDRTGEARVREHGGPTYWMGNLTRPISRTVDVFRGGVHPALFRQSLSALRAIGFPSPDQLENLYPDEIPCWVRLRHASGDMATLGAPGRLLDWTPELRAMASAMDHIIYTSTQAPSVDSIPNPEWDQWPDEARRAISREEGAPAGAAAGARRGIAARALGAVLRTLQRK